MADRGSQICTDTAGAGHPITIPGVCPHHVLWHTTRGGWTAACVDDAGGGDGRHPAVPAVVFTLPEGINQTRATPEAWKWNHVPLPEL